MKSTRSQRRRIPRDFGDLVESTHELRDRLDEIGEGEIPHCELEARLLQAEATLKAVEALYLIETVLRDWSNR